MDTSFLKSIRQRLKGRLSGSAGDSCAADAKCFSESQASEAAFDAVDRGTCTVPIDRIVGSVGRYHDFDRQFQIRRHVPSERLVRIKTALKQGKLLPPVKLYQIKDEYYVMDGNHRVAAARELGHECVRADILEFIPSKNTLENILYREKKAFVAQTGLPDTLALTEVGQYLNLERQVEKHRQHLSNERGADVPIADAAADWYRTIYQPLAAIIEKGGLLESFPQRTLTDLYTYISSHQWDHARRRKYGIGIDKLIEADMEAFRKKMADKQEREYPEMLRGITAFVLMKVRSKTEFRIMEKLFKLPEVREIHSVHGDVDIIVKIVLTRDLLSSDAEMIGQFVHENVRGISGVTSTQTLIPGHSKIKDT